MKNLSIHRRIAVLILIIALVLNVFLGEIGTAASQSSTIRADALVIVNSESGGYIRYERWIQPYLEHFGVPYDEWDIAVSPPPAEMDSYALIIIGHSELDILHQYLTPAQEALISAAVNEGTGLVNFDWDLVGGDLLPYYDYTQDVFAFDYFECNPASYIHMEPNPELGGYITALQPTGPGYALNYDIPCLGVYPPDGSGTLAYIGYQPMVVAVNYGAGRAVQWTAINWMAAANRGYVYGLDDLIWRSLVWAARKPFVLQGLPPFMTMRVDDVEGPFDWLDTAVDYGFKPWNGIFFDAISDIPRLKQHVDNGNATVSIHARDYNDFFYFDHDAHSDLPDPVIQQNFADGTAWHTTHQIPISKYVVPHYYEIGTNAFAGLSAWGVEFVTTLMTPGNPYGSSRLMLGPFFRYESPCGSSCSAPFYYADVLPVPGHPEFDGDFHVVVAEVRDIGGYEWFPSNDVEDTIDRGVKQLRRALSGMELATLFTHEYYIQDIDPANWEEIMQGITAGVADYAPEQVTMDFAVQYVRAVLNSQISGSVYNPVTGNLDTTLTGATDMPTRFYLFTEDGGVIHSQFVTVPVFSGSTVVSHSLALPTNPVITLSAAAYAVSEGTAQVTITVNIYGTRSGDVQVDYTTADGTATAGADYTAASGTLTFTPTDTSRTFSVTILDDAVDEDNETFTVSLANPTGGATLGNPSSAVVTIQDNDTASIFIDPTSGLTVTEAGGTAAFTVRLTSEPLANVTIGLSSSDPTEGTVSPASLTFTSGNWSTPKTVTITGVDDAIQDGNIPFTIITSPAVSADPRYDGMDAADVSVICIDNDTAGITVNPTVGLTVTEATGVGHTTIFTVVLNTQPTADVTISLSSSDTTESTVSPAALTFTAADWSTPKTVTITGEDDFIDDDNVPFTIITAPAVSGDPNYDGMDAADVSVTCIDNDTAGITVSPIGGLTVTEAPGAGHTATFTMRLTSEPLANVTIGISSDDPSEGTVSPTSLTFTSGDWNSPKVVTITGVDDFVDDDNVLFTIVTAAAVSMDPKYNGMDAANVSVTCIDDDTAGVTVNPTSGLTVTEAPGAGNTAAFTIVLNTQPTANVTIGVSSSDTTEGTVSPSSVTFTTTNWNTPQTITITGVDDPIDDDDVAFTIVTANATSADPKYSGMPVADVSVTNIDDDTAGVTVNPTSGLTVTEAPGAGNTAAFTIVLNTQPTANVTIGVSSSDTSEGTVSPSSVTFTTTNWNTPQTITITGVDDLIDDDDVVFTIVTAATSTDPKYNGIPVADVSVTNIDNDTAGVTVNPTSGLTVTEAPGAGNTAAFTIVLNTQPTANVTIGVSSSDTTEGTVSPSSVTFTTTNWNTAQTITITGVDDLIDDDDVAFTIVTAAAASSDPKYSGMPVADVSVTNIDNDTAGVTVNPTSGLTVTETPGAGNTDTFTIVLDTQPTASVTINLSSSDTGEGLVSPTSVTFTTSDWNVPQTVTVTGVDDLVDDDDVGFSIITAPAVSADNKYNNLNANDVAVTNIDNDTAGVTVNPTSGLTVTEATGLGHTATFTIVLNTQPTSNVTIGVTSSDTTEGTVSPSSVTFNPANWNSPQTITITGVDDPIDDDDVAFTIVTTATSTDPKYNGIPVADVSVTNIDNDTAGVTVNPTSGLTVTEAPGAGNTATFTIVLDTQPTANVTIGVSSSDTTEGTVSPASVTFTTTNWNTPQTITITGVDDPIDDDNVVFTIVTAAAASSDPKYNNLPVADVSVTNIDDDTAGVTVNPTSGLTVTEAPGAGNTAAFAIVLNTQPTANVTIGVSSSDTTEGTVSPSSVTFNPANWNSPQTITITGVDDPIDDDDVAFTIVTAAAASSDPKYNNLPVADVSVTNIDNDTAGVTVNPTSGLTVTEAPGAGNTAAFTIVLDTQPTANVTIGVSSSDTTEGTVSPASVTFTTTNWNTPQTITITGVDDAIDDDNVAFSIVTAATSTDPKYNGIPVADVSVTNIDNDTAGVTVNPTSGLTVTEAPGAGNTAAFTIVLNTQPTANVTIGVSSSDTTEGTVSPASVTFTTTNWNTPQTITITGVDDAIQDGNIAFTIVTAAAASSDPKYNNLPVADVSVTNIDNDTAGVTVNPTSGLTVTEAPGAGNTAAFTIVLNTQPTANVTIGVSSSDTSEGTVSPSSVTFTTTNWSTPQTITITGVDDAIDDDNVAFSIVTGAASSSDPNYNNMPVDDVSVTNIDNDTAGVTVNPTSGLTVTEAPGAGNTAAFTIVLNTQPTANVTIGVSSSDTTEGTVSPSSVTFTTTNWSTPQTITITGVDDPIDDDDVAFTIVTANASSSDPKYNNLPVADVSVTNIDNDTAGVTVNPTSGLTVTEAPGAGNTATFTIVLNTQPTANVTISVSSSDNTEGTVSPSSVTFTTANWNTAQTITITGVDDSIFDGDKDFTILTAAAVSADPVYDGMAVDDVSATCLDDDPAPVIAFSSSEYSVAENGGSLTITVTISGAREGTIGVTYETSDGTANAGLDYTTASGTLTFAPADLSQSFTVDILPDAILEGNEIFAVTLSAPSGGAVLGVPATASAIILDDEDEVDLSILQSAEPDPVLVGGLLTYHITVANAGPNPALVVTMKDTLPAGVIFVSADGTGWSCGEASGVVTCTRSELAVGAASLITLVGSAPTVAGEIVNTAWVSTISNESNLIDNEVTTTVSVQPHRFYLPVIQQAAGGAAASLPGGKVNFWESLLRKLLP